MKNKLHENRTFGDEVLQSSIEEKIDFFSNQRIKHANLSEAYDDLLIKAEPVGGVEFIQLVGSTGAGKTRAAKKFAKGKLEENKTYMQENPEVVPVVYVECPASVGDRFPWQPLFKNILKTGGELLLDRGNYVLDYSEGVSQKEISRILLKDNSIPDLAEVVQGFLKKRKVQYLIIDEAQHIIDACRTPKEAFRCMEMLKSIATLSGCIIVLVGTYRLLRFGEISAQLGRRSEIIELRPYQRGSVAELKNFGEALDALLQRYPTAFADIIFEKVEDIHLACCGCIGILKDWLTKTLYRTLKSGKSYVTFKDLMANRMDPRELRQVAKEIRMGRDYFCRVSMLEVEEMLLGDKTKVVPANDSKGVQRKLERDEAGGADYDGCV
ncbi:TniB family NTP-binding protein [Endozoicomonas ascidiicola]|uniref:TniB family NTP-binding protein n=1 Tax=Endozoicomonas ascidiicola TaxID=1698521 RepID=UPI000831BABA|nr:TniB family NTP-binding protein [Endozoicomonas ascidiicola]